VDIEITDNVLTIRGERKEEETQEGEGWLVRESSYGAFERSLTIPEVSIRRPSMRRTTTAVLEVQLPTGA
jgi:HSP20 family protein